MQQSTITANRTGSKRITPDTLDNLSALVNRKYLQEVIVVDCSDLGSTIEKLNELQERYDSLQVITRRNARKGMPNESGRKNMQPAMSYGLFMRIPRSRKALESSLLTQYRRTVPGGVSMSDSAILPDS